MYRYYKIGYIINFEIIKKNNIDFKTKKITVFVKTTGGLLAVVKFRVYIYIYRERERESHIRKILPNKVVSKRRRYDLLTEEGYELLIARKGPHMQERS